ncbi:fructose-1,6-bisphosphatase, chloroplastic [Nicotiana tabacum]|uniref:fructose-bisphosphatase n=2 Tax=Nicotiana tabacum TaxID=4097 RepID=A0A1S3Z9P3_TOBAC|nr:fructose-1,6-bisphosphatase, chloroplastic-like [Nicotiana tomentosiformis]XP_016461175.1 PREDICTED: fructose-1,6-bisphosphatase, chloroplastic-like [Nicotiana tabacum]
MAEAIPRFTWNTKFSSSSISRLSPNFHLLPTNIKRSQQLNNDNFSSNSNSRSRCEAVGVEGAKTAPAQIKKPINRYEMINLTTWLLRQEQEGNIDAELAIVLSSISLACKQIASLLQRSSIVNLTGAQGTVNIQGEDQKKLDVISNELFCNCLRSSGRTGIIASEEEDVPVAVEETYSGNYIVVFDPIDGSANIDIALTTGSIFGIYGPDQQCLVDMDDDSTIDQAREKCIVSVCQPGSNLVAAGYCLYSSSVVFTLSVGNGVYAFTLDPAYGEFVLTHEDIKIPKAGRIYSFNEGNYDLWDEKLQNYLDHLRQPGPNGKPYSGRYIGCLVGEIHRMLLYGGIYGNPKNKNAKNGNLRLLYECAPMSYIIEQAGGKATDGTQRILEIMPEQIHQRTPIFIGSTEEIEKLEKYLA